MAEKISNLPIILFLLVGVAIAAFNYMDDISTLESLQNKKSNLMSQLKDKQGSLEKAKNARLEIPNLTAELEHLNQVYGKAKGLASGSLAVRDVIESVNREARSSGVRVTQSRPSNTVPSLFDQAELNKKVSPIGLEVELEGSYSQVTSFFTQLSKQKIILLPKDLKVSVKEILDKQVNLKVSGIIMAPRYVENKI